MSDILSETAIPIADAPKYTPGRPHNATFWRWYTKGCWGVKLETYLCGGKRYTSKEALRRFIERTTEARDGAPVEQAPSRRRQAEISKAEAELAAAGI